MGREAKTHLSATQIYPSQSPPHTSSSHSSFPLDPSSPSQELETNTAAIQRIRILDLSRLTLTVLIIATGAAVVGCEARALHAYKTTTQLDKDFSLPPLWPAQGFDLRPTQAMVGAGAVAAGSGLVYLLTGGAPVSDRRKLLMALFSIFFAILGLAGSIFGVAYTSYITSHQGYNRDNIQSWTCRWVDGAANADKLFPNGLAAIAAPAGYKRICMETHVGFTLLAILICLETLLLVVTGLCAWMEVRIRRSERDSDRSDEKHVKIVSGPEGSVEMI